MKKENLYLILEVHESRITPLNSNYTYKWIDEVLFLNKEAAENYKTKHNLSWKGNSTGSLSYKIISLKEYEKNYKK